MGFHTYDVERADALEDPSRYEYLSVEQLLALFGPTEGAAVADLGSGTGFYTEDVAPHAGTVYAVDVQPAMHGRHREKGLSPNVRPVTADLAALPFGGGALDGAFSTMTYHEFASPGAIAELARACAPGARVGIADWTRRGAGEHGPPLDERFDAATAADHFADAGFEVTRAEDRRETFVLSARRE